MTTEEKITNEERLQLENFALRLEALEAQRVATESQREAFTRGMRDRYQLGERDQIDLRTLAIIRAPKPEPAVEKPAEPAPAA